MAIQNASDCVRDRLIVVVAVHQHREDAGNGAGADSRTGPLKQLGQFGEHGRRIALGGRRLACRQADLALGHRKAGDRIHQAQHILVFIAKIFGDR